MRLAIPAIAAALLIIPAAPAFAVVTGLHQAKATDFSAAKRKRAKKAHKVHKTKAPKVEYMRAAPSK